MTAPPRGQPTVKQFLYCMTVNGSGNHLLRDVLTYLEYQHVPYQYLNFWPMYVLAKRRPDAVCPFKSFRGRSAIEALHGYYVAHGFDGTGNLLDLEAAMTCFRVALERFEGERLFSLHCFPLIYSSTYTVEDGRQVVWGREDRDEALALFQNFLERSGYDIKYVGLLRHPVDIYLSNRERFGHIESPSEVKRRIWEFFEVIADQLQRPERKPAIIRYEELCSRDQRTFQNLFKYLDITRDVDVESELAFLHSGELWKHAALPREGRQLLLEDFGKWIDLFEYQRSYKNYSLDLMMSKLRKWKGEIQTLNLVFRGDYRGGGAVFRHKASFLARVYRKVCMLVPSNRRQWENLSLRHHGRRS